METFTIPSRPTIGSVTAKNKVTGEVRRRANRLEGVLQGNTGLPRKPDEGLAAIWLARLALEIVSVLSQIAQSQVRLFLVAPTGRQTYLRPLGRRSLSDFDHAKRKSNSRSPKYGPAPALRWSIGQFHLFSETDQY